MKLLMLWHGTKKDLLLESSTQDTTFQVENIFDSSLILW